MTTRLLALLALFVLSMPAFAETRVVREYSFDLDGIDEIEFHASAGTIRILPSRDDTLGIVLDIEGQDSGWFQRARDVSGVELQSHRRNGRLVLEQTEKKTETGWTIRLPVVASTRIDLGVGAIKGDFGDTALSIRQGVGEIAIGVARESIAAVDLSVGVGEIRLRGLDARHDERAFVSQKVRGRGTGTRDLLIDLGVGEIRVDAE